MKENRINAVIAITALVAAALMAIALSLAISPWSLGGTRYDLTIRFPDATGIDTNAKVKYAGAPVGVVKEVKLLARKDQTQDPRTGQFYCIKVVVEIDKNVDIGQDSHVEIRQDGIGIAAKYVLITPGPDRNSPPWPHDGSGEPLLGQSQADLSSLIPKAELALDTANHMLTQFGPVMDRVEALSDKLNTSLPPLMDNANKFLQNGNDVLANLNTPESKQRINDLLANLRVSTDNLKVVLSNAKALTLTLAQKPWRLVWGGSTVQAPAESDVLKSNEVIPLKPEVDVTPAPAPGPPAPEKKKTTPISQP